MYDNLVYTGTVGVKERIKAAWKSFGIVWNALHGYVVSGMDMADKLMTEEGAEIAYREIINEMTSTMNKAAKILEDGYHGKAPDHPNFKPAWDAYCIIKDFFRNMKIE